MLLKEQEIAVNFISRGKFVNKTLTAKGETRASVPLVKLDTLWFNTGTRCNLECQNCYIESSPSNNALSFITEDDVRPFLDEIVELDLGTKHISFTGGEPFLNKHMLPIIRLCLSRGFEVLVLTNAYRLIESYLDELNDLNKAYAGQLKLRVSLDHFSKEIHEKERGKNTFTGTLTNIKRLNEMGFQVSIAGRSLANENLDQALAGYQATLDEANIGLTLRLGENIVIFPEMSTTKDVPEITTQCWEILDVHPHQQMCASERMVVKRKDSDKPVVLPCTLIAYNEKFELGNQLKEAFQPVYLNHPYCAQFCVLGGASCSG
jgi:sulfatase maturation enzyme AslB (radical SAM superfamily)